MREEVEKFEEGLQARLLRFTAKPLPTKQSVKLKCPKILRN